MERERQFILDLLQTHSLTHAPEGEPFTLASGEKSDWYIDVKKTALRAGAHLPLAALLYNELAEGAFGAVEAVAGVALGGCHLASIVGLYASLRGMTRLNVIHVRKEVKDHGTMRLFEAPSPMVNESVVLLEDVVTTGESAMRAISVLMAAGYSVHGTVAVVDRRPKDRRVPTLGGPDFKALFTSDDFGYRREVR
jgi:orotate phosphoribosyltransferase